MTRVIQSTTIGPVPTKGRKVTSQIEAWLDSQPKQLKQTVTVAVPGPPPTRRLVTIKNTVLRAVNKMKATLRGSNESRDLVTSSYLAHADLNHMLYLAWMALHVLSQPFQKERLQHTLCDYRMILSFVANYVLNPSSTDFQVLGLEFRFNWAMRQPPIDIRSKVFINKRHLHNSSSLKLFNMHIMKDSPIINVWSEKVILKSSSPSPSTLDAAILFSARKEDPNTPTLPPSQPGFKTGTLELAYRITPVHPDQQNDPCICWRGLVYVDRAVMFELTSSAGVFGIFELLDSLPRSAPLCNPIPINLNCWGNASTSFGIRLVIGHCWAVWKWAPGFRVGPGLRYDIG
ncbi:hypothetical protein C8R48DRAFT_671520 [Suillus tomentosus]|nr:hypothetical protein C8R48DRAFT_671520 [Suillus tomentosus]